MADDKTLRRELATFPLAVDAPDSISKEDRPGLVPVLMHLLWPRLRKRTGKQAKKGPAGSSRKAVQHFLASMEPSELRHLMHMALHPISAAMHHLEGRTEPEHVPDANVR